MPDCEKLPKCPFFNDKMSKMPTMSEFYKKNYCHEDNTTCARYRVSKSGKEVPADLFPNQADRANSILKQ